MFWKRTVGIDGSTFYLHRNIDDDPLCKFFLTIELLQDIDYFKKGNDPKDNPLIRSIEVGIRDLTDLTEEDIEKAINILYYMQYEER